MSNNKEMDVGTIDLSRRLTRHIDALFYAHTFRPKTPKDAVRRFDLKTPYAVHPLWCAMAILQEPQLPERSRYAGATVLIFHDVPEDTLEDLPLDLTQEEREGVVHMTFDGLNDEMARIWDKPPFVRLLKLYDKVSNLLDGSWMSVERRREVTDYVLKLADDVEQNWGKLNIVTIARALSA